MDLCGESEDDYLSGGGDDDVVREVQMQALSTSSVFGVVLDVQRNHAGLCFRNTTATS